MSELEQLRAMWTPKFKRVTNLIVRLSYDGSEGSLKNESWAFNVPYAFRDALDIKYEQRMKKLEPFWVWTQGPLLSFTKGDLINSRDGFRAVQIESASQMEWNYSKNEMDQGTVVYTEYSITSGRYIKLMVHTCTQMQFLQLLIHGRYDSQSL